MHQENTLFKDKSISTDNPFPVYILFILLIGTMLLGNLISALCFSLMDVLSGLDSKTLLLEGGIENKTERNYIRWISGIGHLLTFFVPALITLIFVFRRNWVKHMALDKFPKPLNIILGSFFVLMAFPLVQLSYLINKAIPMPGWATSMEDSANRLIESLTIMNSPEELFLNLFIIAIIPAIGEEFIFRGIIQQQLQTYFRQGWIAVWCTAFLFSAFHLQFAGFLPRLILGACLGYLFYWTKNLWIPIVAHAVVNGSQVVGKYYINQEIEDVPIEENLQSFGPVFVILTIAFIGLGYLLINMNARSNNHRKSTNHS